MRHPTPLNLLRFSPDTNVWHCLCEWEKGSLPLHLGGLGLRSASLTSHAAYWGSWADCLGTTRVRHAHVADTMAAALSRPPASATHLLGAAHSRDVLAIAGFENPEWSSLFFAHQFDQAPQVMGGSSLLLKSRRLVSILLSCGRAFLPPSTLFCARSLDRWLVCLFLASLRLACSCSLLRCFASFSSVTSGFHCTLPLSTAGVAVHSTSLATTAQLAREQESLRVGVPP